MTETTPTLAELAADFARQLDELRELGVEHARQADNAVSELRDDLHELAKGIASAASADDDRDCPGHPAGPYDPMGETVYCDGSCQPRQLATIASVEYDPAAHHGGRVSDSVEHVE